MSQEVVGDARDESEAELEAAHVCSDVAAECVCALEAVVGLGETLGAVLYMQAPSSQAGGRPLGTNSINWD